MTQQRPIGPLGTSGNICPRRLADLFVRRPIRTANTFLDSLYADGVFISVAVVAGNERKRIQW